MNTLRLHVINSHSPYEVRQNPHDVNSYLFKTDANVEYVISLIENNSIVPSGTYEFGINNPKHNKSPLDPKLRNTIFAIVEEFFDVNGDEAMLYLADTGDGHKISLPEMNERINALLQQSIKSNGVINLFSDVKGRFSLFDPKFLAEIAKMKEKNLAVELLRKLIAEQVHIYKRTNVVKSEKFSKIIHEAMNRYNISSLMISV